MDVFTTLRGLVGLRNYNGDQEVNFRAGRQGQIISDPYGRFYQVAKDGFLWHAVTTDAGVAPGTDSVATTQAVSLYNPPGSNVDLVVLCARLAYNSGTLGAGEMLWTKNTDSAAAAPTGTAMVVSAGRLGGGAGVAVALQAATVPAAPTLLRVFCSLDASLASSVVGPWVVPDDVWGSIIVPPGMSVNLAADAAAGSTPLVAISLCWAQVPQ